MAPSLAALAAARSFDPKVQAARQRARDAAAKRTFHSFLTAGTEAHGKIPRPTPATFGIPGYAAQGVLPAAGVEGGEEAGRMSYMTASIRGLSGFSGATHPGFVAALNAMRSSSTLSGLAALTFRESLSRGLDVSRQVNRVVAIQQRLYSALANPGIWQKLANANELALIRGDVDRWNSGVAGRWWAPDTTTAAIENEDNFQRWIEEGKKTYDEAAAIAQRLNDTSLLSDIRAARALFVQETQDSLIAALNAVKNVGSAAVNTVGTVVNTAAGEASKVGNTITNFLGSTAFKIVGLGVLTLGGLALGLYLLKRGGLKANVNVPGLPVKVGVGALAASPRQRRAQNRMKQANRKCQGISGAARKRCMRSALSHKE